MRALNFDLYSTRYLFGILLLSVTLGGRVRSIAAVHVVLALLTSTVMANQQSVICCPSLARAENKEALK